LSPQLFVRSALAFLLLPFLSGCGGNVAIVTDSARLLFGPPAADSVKLNPAFQYIRVAVNKNVALLVLGYVDAEPQAETEVWYSASKETIRLWRGRLAGTAGLNTDWRSVRFTDVPSFKSAMQGSASYRRQRDVMPGYVVGAREQVLIRPIAVPQKTNLVGVPAQSLQWFEELTAPEGLAPTLPPARFAVDMSGSQERVIYSEQCISAQFCLTLQAWPAQPAATPS
jgi:hypothetical protein